MAEERFVFEDVSHLTAAARGVPGKRTFYLVVGHGKRWLRLWLEKEELQALATAVDQVLASLPHPGQEPAGPDALGPEPPEPPDGEFRIGRLALGHDAGRDMLVLQVHQREAPTTGPPALQFSASKAQMGALSQRIKEVCAAGRPLCRLCGGPVDPEGHPCPKANGHRSLELELR